MSAQLAALLLIAFAGFLPAQSLQRIPLTCTVQGDTLTLSWPTVTNTWYVVWQGYDPVGPWAPARELSSRGRINSHGHDTCVRAA